MKKIILVSAAVLFLFTSVILPVQTGSLTQAVELSGQAYFHYDKDLMLKSRSMVDSIYQADKSNLTALFYITTIDYKLLEMSLQPGNEALFDKYYEPALNEAEKLTGSNKFKADGKILTAAIYMMKIATSSLSAVSLSPKIHSLLDEAQEIDPLNPYSYLIRGQMKYNTPGVFGGSYKDAMDNFNKAISLYEDQDNTNKPAPAWGYEETLAWLGRSLIELDNLESAEFTYKKALTKQPEYAWVKYVLLPELQKKLAEK